MKIYKTVVVQYGTLNCNNIMNQTVAVSHEVCLSNELTTKIAIHK